MKNILDKLAKKYETKDFIKNDPIQFPHRFSKKEDIEISGFISSLFAYGKRELFIKKLNEIFEVMENKPLEYIINCRGKNPKLKNFKYRFIKECDLINLLDTLHILYKKDKSSLEELFSNGTQSVCDYFYKHANKECSMGFYHMLSNPSSGGAQKRYNMFLRWMIRKGEVDLGVWSFKKPSELFIPLDVHVARLSRKHNLLNRSSNDFKAVVELTNKLKEFDPNDPIKYDFALFGLGVNQASQTPQGAAFKSPCT